MRRSVGIFHALWFLVNLSGASFHISLAVQLTKCISMPFFFLASCTKFKKGTTVLVSFVPNKLNKIALWYFCYAVFVKMLSLQCWQLLLDFLSLILGHLSSQTVSKIWFESREVNLAQRVDLPFRWRTWHWSLKLSACYMPLWALLCFCPNRPSCVSFIHVIWVREAAFQKHLCCLTQVGWKLSEV